MAQDATQNNMLRRALIKAYVVSATRVNTSFSLRSTGSSSLPVHEEYFQLEHYGFPESHPTRPVRTMANGPLIKSFTIHNLAIGSTVSWHHMNTNRSQNPSLLDDVINRERVPYHFVSDLQATACVPTITPTQTAFGWISS